LRPFPSRTASRLGEGGGGGGSYGVGQGGGEGVLLGAKQSVISYVIIVIDRQTGGQKTIEDGLTNIY